MESKRGSRGASCVATLGAKTIGGGCPPPANEENWDGGWEDNDGVGKYDAQLGGGMGEQRKSEEAWENGGNRGQTVMRLGGRLGECTKWDDNWEN